MNILLYSTSFLPKIGGRELVIYQLARALTRLGHTVRVVGPRFHLRPRPPDVGVRVHRYPRLAKGKLRANGRPSRLAGLAEAEMMLQLVLDVRAFGADVIHAHTTYPTGYLAARARRWLPDDVPLVITPHGADINVIPGFGLRLNDEWKEKIGQALLAADAVTAISQGIARAIAEAGAPADRIHRVANGTDLDRFSSRPPAPAVRERFGLAPEDRIVLTVGNYHPRKGMEDLIRAFPLIVEQEPRARLVIAGGGTDVLLPVARAAGVAEQVRLTGRLPLPLGGANGSGSDPLADLYSESSVYVSASNDPEAEGLSLAILDALAAGKPAVATRISGNEDVVAHGVSGFLVEPRNPADLARRTLELLHNGELAQRMGHEGRRRASELSWLSIAEQYLRVYEAARSVSGDRAAVQRA